MLVSFFVCFLFVCLFLIRGISLTNPVLASFLYMGNLSYTSPAGFIFVWDVSLTHPVLALILSGDFPLHI